MAKERKICLLARIFTIEGTTKQDGSILLRNEDSVAGHNVWGIVEKRYGSGEKVNPFQSRINLLEAVSSVVYAESPAMLELRYALVECTCL